VGAGGEERAFRHLPIAGHEGVKEHTAEAHQHSTALCPSLLEKDWHIQDWVGVFKELGFFFFQSLDV